MAISSAVALLSVGCSVGSDGHRSSVAAIEIDDVDDLEAARALWSSNERDGYRLTLEGEVDGQSASVQIIVDGGQLRERTGSPDTLDARVDQLFERFDAAFVSGANPSGSYDPATGHLVDVELSATVDQPSVEASIIEYQHLDRPDGCAAPAGTIRDIRAEPIEYQIFDDARRFTDGDGCIIRLDVVHVFSGWSFCGWESMRYLVIGDHDPLINGDDPVQLGAGTRTYVFDPDDVLGDFDAVDRDRTIAAASLPSSATPTNLASGDGALWLNGDDTSIAYLVSGGVAREMVLDPDNEITCE